MFMNNEKQSFHSEASLTELKQGFSTFINRKLTDLFFFFILKISHTFTFQEEDTDKQELKRSPQYTIEKGL